MARRGGQRSTQPAGCPSGPRVWWWQPALGVVHCLLAPCQPLAAHLGPRPIATLFTPHQSRSLQQRLSAPCPGVRIPCSRTCPSAHPPPSPRLLLQCSPAMPPAQTPLQLHLPSQTRGLESRRAVSAAPQQGPSPGRWAIQGLGTLKQGGQSQGPCVPTSPPLDAEPDASSAVSAHLSWLRSLDSGCSSGWARARQREGAESLSWSPPSLHALGRAAGPPRPPFPYRGSWAVRPASDSLTQAPVQAALPGPRRALLKTWRQHKCWDVPRGHEEAAGQVSPCSHLGLGPETA